jgi:hypothetical protein
MTEFRGTPGPWFTDSDGIIRQTPPIATGYYSPIPLASAFIGTAWQGGNQTEESYSNAKMAAAAPDLLNACIDAIGALEQDLEAGRDSGDADWEGLAYERLEAAKAAIAKALGQ